MTRELAFAIAWRLVAFFLLGAPIVAIKHAAIVHYGCDPYWVGRRLGSIDTLIFIALIWRWLPVRIAQPKAGDQS